MQAVPISLLNPAARLVEALGGRSAVAARFNISTEAVRKWLKHGIPPDLALEVEEVTASTPFAVTAIEVLEYRRAAKPAA